MDTIFYFAWEAELILLIQSLMGPAGILLMSFFTMFGEETVITVILGFLYWGWNKELGERLAVNLFSVSTVCPLIKNSFYRLRPYFVIKEVKCLKPVENGDIYDVLTQGYSFPSAHTASAAATYGTLAVYSRKRIIKTVLYLLIAAVGVSRFSLGVHYPTDVIAGAVLGLISVCVSSMIDVLQYRKAYFNILITLCSPGLLFCSTEDYFTCFGLMCGGLTGMLYEREHIRFRSTNRIGVITVRIVCGIAVFVSIVNLLKIAETGLNGSVSEKVVLYWRSIRYAAASFVTIGLYPYFFRSIDRMFKEN